MQRDFKYLNQFKSLTELGDVLRGKKQDVNLSQKE